MTRFDKVIPPGSEGKVYASLDISHIKDNIEKHIDLETNDPDRPRAHLIIKAYVKTYVDIKPADSLYFTVGKGQRQTQEVTLVPTYEKPIVLSNPTVTSDLLDLKMESSDQPGADHESQYKLKITLKETAPIGTQNAHVKVTVQGAPLKEIDIPVTVLVRGPITVLPPAVSFVIRTFPEEVITVKEVEVHPASDPTAPTMSKAAAGSKLRVIMQKDIWYQVITAENRIGWVDRTAVKATKESEPPTPQTVSLQKANGRNFKLLDFSTDLTQVKVEKIQVDPKAETANNYNFKITLLHYDPNKKGNISGALTVKTDEADQPVLRIPVYIIVS